MNRKIVLVIAAAALAVVSPAALAVAQTPAAKAEPAQSRAAAGPTVSASAVGIRRAAPAPAMPAAAERRLGAGRNVALMVVGGAALIIGLIIGHAEGAIIAVAGAVVGLYGLYNFIQ